MPKTVKPFQVYTLSELQLIGRSKGEMFAAVESTFDYALPQRYLDELTEYATNHPAQFPTITYHAILSTTVMEYPSGCCGRLLTCCKEVAELIEAYHENN